MAGFEDLIRGALDKHEEGGRPVSAERREAIYQSSRTALGRMLSHNTGLSEEAVAQQGAKLEEAIVKIEADYRARELAPTPPPPPPPAQAPVPAPMPAAPPVDTSPSVDTAPPAPYSLPADTPTVDPARPVPEPSVDPRPFDGSVTPPVERLEPEIPATFVAGQDVADADPVVIPSDYRGPALRESKSYAKWLLWTIILVGLGVAAWWAYTFGPGLLREQLEGSVPNPRPQLEQGAFIPGTAEGWVQVFDPSQDAGNIATEGRGTAELMQAEAGMFARLASNAGSARNTLRLSVPPGALEAVRGKSATVELFARNPEGGEQQFAILCEFGAFGTCGRKRFEASGKVEGYVFSIDVADTVQRDGETAWLTINTDLGGNGAPLDVYGVRMREGR